MDLSLPRRWANKKPIYLSAILSHARETWGWGLERGRKGSLGRERAAEVDFQGRKTEESIMRTKSRKNSKYEGTEDTE